MKTSDITALLNKRKAIYKKNSKDKQVDKLAKQIKAAIEDNFNSLEVDFIIETLTHLGEAPCVMYDDNGMFAVSGAGYQPVVTGKQRIEGAITVFVEKKQWKKTIRAALKHYLQDRA